MCRERAGTKMEERTGVRSRAPERMAEMAGIFTDRTAAGGALAGELEEARALDPVVVGLARGGVEVAAELARRLDAPLDVVAVRKVGHPRQPEYGIGAVTPGDVVYVRGPDGLTRQQLAAAVAKAKEAAEALDRRLHRDVAPIDLDGRTVLLVDDGLATGATMLAALRWARAAGAARVVVAVPVAAAESVASVREEADRLVALHVLSPFFAVGVWYGSFEQVDDATVVRLLEENRHRVRAVGSTP
jgi:putative phosphoribosyl transferase